MNGILILTIVLIVIMVGADLIRSRQKKRRMMAALSDLNDALDAHDSKRFWSLYDEDKQLFPAFNAAFIKLNGAIAEHDSKLVSQALDELMLTKPNRRQLSAAASLAFNYYMDAKDYEAARRWLDTIEGLDGNDALKRRSRWLYDAYAQKGDAYLEDVLEAIAHSEGVDRGYYELIAGQIYRNRSQAELAERYQQAARKDLGDAGSGNPAD
jgi:spermidine/putrescine-binding protein